MISLNQNIPGNHWLFDFVMAHLKCILIFQPLDYGGGKRGGVSKIPRFWEVLQLWRLNLDTSEKTTLRHWSARQFWWFWYQFKRVSLAREVSKMCFAGLRALRFHGLSVCVERIWCVWELTSSLICVFWVERFMLSYPQDQIVSNPISDSSLTWLRQVFHSTHSSVLG